MRVFAGADADALAPRGDVARPATVGVLVETLRPGCRHRWDEANSVVVRVEGQAPASQSEVAVLAGGNAVAIETAEGWELVQFRSATLLGDGVWRLTGLLRRQQGTVATGAAAGAVVVFLDHELARAATSRAERGLPLVWRAGPAGGPAGGAGVGEISFTLSGVHERPWSPAHPKAVGRADGGLDLSWIPRLRVDGDRWDGETAASGSSRFRVCVMDGLNQRRSFEVESPAATCSAVDLAADFPGGLNAGSYAAVAQWGDGYGWGRDVFVSLMI